MRLGHSEAGRGGPALRPTRLRPAGGRGAELPSRILRTRAGAPAGRPAGFKSGRHPTIGGPVFVAAHGITKAIDEMAFLLTGDREYFWGVGGGATEAYRQKMADCAARERGDLPWP